MTDKEKEAIKFLYNLRATIDESIMLFDEDINVKCGKETIKQITTVLNLIQTQQAEIEKKDNKLKDIENHIKAELNLINKCLNEVKCPMREQYEVMKAVYKCLLNIFFEYKVEEDK